MKLLEIRDEEFASKEDEVAFLKDKKAALTARLHEIDKPLQKLRVDHNPDATEKKIHVSTEGQNDPRQVIEAPTAFAKFTQTKYHASPALVKHPIGVGETYHFWVIKTEPHLVELVKRYTKKSSQLSWAIADIECKEYRLLIDGVRAKRAERTESRKLREGKRTPKKFR